MVPSAVINEAIVFFTAIAMYALIRRTPKEKIPESFRYFTVLSNLFCTLTAFILLVCELAGAMPAWAVTLKYMGTAAVALTLFTVFLYLLPTLRSTSGLLDHFPELIMHLITPVLAIFSFISFENEGISPWIIPLGLLPEVLYGWLYLDRVLFAKTWKDMYGFVRNGKWKMSFSILALGSVLICILLLVL